MTRTPLAGALAGLVGDIAHEEGPFPGLNGAVETGHRAAAEVLAAVG